MCRWPMPGSLAPILSGNGPRLAFIHLAVNTFESWHSTALEVIARLGCQLARATNGKQGMVVRHLRQQLWVLLMWDNVAMLES